jgi:hypothetical protein
MMQGSELQGAARGVANKGHNECRSGPVRVRSTLGIQAVTGTDLAAPAGFKRGARMAAIGLHPA